MPELRKDPIVRSWVIISTERAKRPHDFAKPKEEKVSKFDPFAPGNESVTPPEIMAFRPADTEPNTPGWWIRVVPNKFPALDPNLDLKKLGHGMYDSMTGFGAHEIVIETPDSEATIATLDYKQVEEIVWAYRERYTALLKDENIKYVLIFKNYGADAGASLSHSHSQIIATPTIPSRVATEIEGSGEYYKFRERCIYCDIIQQEKMENTRIVEENDDFIAFEPYASRAPFETWILPKTHQYDFGEISEKNVKSFAAILKNVLLRMRISLDDPPYNFMIHTGMPSGEGRNYYHWHVEIVPRLTKLAGFEWGSGFYINPTPPEEAAKYLREVDISKEA
jgi:UDPglucose--hexose-1-phosphate uridylyltransferase